MVPSSAIAGTELIAARCDPQFSVGGTAVGDGGHGRSSKGNCIWH